MKKVILDGNGFKHLLIFKIPAVNIFNRQIFITQLSQFEFTCKTWK